MNMLIAFFSDPIAHWPQLLALIVFIIGGVFLLRKFKSKTL